MFVLLPIIVCRIDYRGLTHALSLSHNYLKSASHILWSSDVFLKLQQLRFKSQAKDDQRTRCSVGHGGDGI